MTMRYYLIIISAVALCFSIVTGLAATPDEAPSPAAGPSETNPPVVAPAPDSPPADTTPPAAANSVGLENYRLAGGPVIMEGVDDNASDIVFSRKTGTLFAVLNNPTVVVELDLMGNVKRRIDLNAFDDTEGITWIEGDRFGVLEERRRKLVIVEIAADTKSVEYTNCQQFVIESCPPDNAGIEGAAYDSAAQRFFVVKEKEPRKVYEVRLPVSKTGPQDETPPQTPTVTNPWDAEKSAFDLIDLSGLCYDLRTGHLLIVSDESKCVVECTVDGKEISRLFLKSGSAGLQDAIPPQPEGITMDESGNLYISSEPNQLYIFKNTTAKQPVEVE